MVYINRLIRTWNIFIMKIEKKVSLGKMFINWLAKRRQRRALKRNKEYQKSLNK